MEITKLLVFIFLLLAYVKNVNSQEHSLEATPKKETKINAVQSLSKGKIGFHQSDNITNEIPYFDNRFRIDAELDEITLIFFRTRGSKPIILVQPDGKKLRVSDFDKKKVQWHDDRTFDMIKITKPMPGPWQAIGNILPDSKILVVSDVKIEVDPLPEVVLSGETLKVTGKLYNGDEKINVTQFKEVVHLDVNFFSTNNSAYDNFGSDGFKLTSFRDDGHDLDEYAGDNLYTGEFLLDFITGEWQPVYIVKLPLITRELRQKPILLHHSPVTISVETSETETSPHRLILTIDSTYVDPSSLVFQGKTTYPDKQTRPFSITDVGINEDVASRSKDIPYTEPGIHRVNLSAFGKTKTGREFRLVVPEFPFNVKGDLNELMLTTLDKNGVEQTVSIDKEAQVLADVEAKLAEEKVLQIEIEQEKNTQTIIMIAAGNAIIIILALVLFFFMRKRKEK